MKHCYKLIAAALMVVLSTFVIAGCNKNEDTADDALKQGEATLARIMDFKQQVDYYKANPAIKDGETMTLDEAIWDIEALFNLTYAYPELSYGHTVTADTVLYLPVGAGNTVLLTDLTVFYGQMYDVVRGIYQGIELDNKQFLILDVEAGALNGGQQAIKLHSVQGSVKGTQPPLPEPPGIEYGPFEPCEDWFYGQNGGMRNHVLEGIMDAADTISGMLNALLIPVAPNGYDYIYTHQLLKTPSQNYTFHHGNYPNLGPYCEFYIENPTDDEKWMNTDQMNFHYLGEKHLVRNILPYQEDPIPSTHSLFKVVVQDYEIQGVGNTIIRHCTDAYYGHRDIVGHGSVIKENLQ